MYTGITRGTFAITEVHRKPDLLSYKVALPAPLMEGLEIGASVAIDGVCQTVTGFTEGPDGGEVAFDAIKETLDRTTLAALDKGSRVSVERSYRIGDELGGHELSGHVIGTGHIQAVEQAGHEYAVQVGVPKDWMAYILEKGFIAVDGSSLTVGRVDPKGSFWLHLIPETLRLTNLGNKRAGDRVNIELDARTVAVVETVERILAQKYGQTLNR